MSEIALPTDLATGHAGLRITGVQTLTFGYVSHVGQDDEGHGHPAPAHRATQRLTRIQTNAGIDGYCFGGSEETAAVARQLLAGLNPLDREVIHARLHKSQRLEWRALAGRMIGVLDQAVWDATGKLIGLPVYRLLGGFRERVPAYASTMCGDDMAGGLDSPEAYAAFAQACVAQGYRAFKLHTWMPPYGPDLKRDVAACRAVREAVGPEIALMLDPYHNYTREEALYLGRALEELGYHWMEEPMDEHSTSSYVWLCQQLDLPICGPESVEGGLYTRAEWIARGAADISRMGMEHGGITPTMKTVHLCEAFGMRLELHGGGAGALHVLGAMAIPGEFYERGLLHPQLDFDAQQPWLRAPIDPLDAEGKVPVPSRPGLGEEIDWEYIRANLVEDWH
jgi:L-alanine-DL-glutamate epimerase-like enolase superfamily enzyme